MRIKQFSKSLSVALPSEDFEQIKRITDDEQISIAEWEIDAISAALNNNSGNYPELKI